MGTTHKLTDRQEKFIQEYLVDRNATQACIRAGYSKKTATVMGSENLLKPHMRSRIDELISKDAEALTITRQEILQDLKNIKDSHKGKGDYPPHALKAIEILNKMLGYNEAEKTEIKHTWSVGFSEE
jgi:hypothetical protein